MKPPSRPPREPAPTKLTKAGKIMGRPVGKPLFGPRAPEPRTKLYLVGERWPRPVLNPTTGELVRAFGPATPVYERREVKRGRPRKAASAIVREIVQATNGKSQNGYVAALIAQEARATVNLATAIETKKRSMRRIRQKNKKGWS